MFLFNNIIYGSMRGKRFGCGEVSVKMLLVRIIENNKIDAYFRSG